MRISIFLVALCLVVAGWIGSEQAKIFPFPAKDLDWNNLEAGFNQSVGGFESIQFFTVRGVSTVWLQNLRAVGLATVLGLFSFGVIGILVVMLPFVLIGYFVAAVAHTGLSPGIFILASIFPHGILEIPAIILSGGAALRLGATLAAPAQGRTMSEALLCAFADWARIMVALVIPMLFVAAILEIYITPRVVIQLLGN